MLKEGFSIAHAIKSDGGVNLGAVWHKGSKGVDEYSAWFCQRQGSIKNHFGLPYHKDKIEVARLDCLRAILKEPVLKMVCAGKRRQGNQQVQHYNVSEKEQRWDGTFANSPIILREVLSKLLSHSSSQLVTSGR